MSEKFYHMYPTHTQLCVQGDNGHGPTRHCCLEDQDVKRMALGPVQWTFGVPPKPGLGGQLQRGGFRVPRVHCWGSTWQRGDVLLWIGHRAPKSGALYSTDTPYESLPCGLKCRAFQVEVGRRRNFIQATMAHWSLAPKLELHSPHVSPRGLLSS